MLSILTVNFHNTADLARFARSIESHRGNESIELVIANHASDESQQLPRADALQIQVVEQPNLGFAAGINAAFAASRGDLIFVANPDIQLRPDALATAREYLAAHPDVGLLLPRLRYPDGRVQPSVRRFYTWPVALYARSPLRIIPYKPRFFRDYLYEGSDPIEPTQVDWGLGGAMFLRRADVSNNQVFDPRFFLYFEDVDLCLRTWQSGRFVIYHPHVECTHAHQRASALPFNRHAWHHAASFLAFVRKHGGLPQRPATP